ncbi:putative protocadherin beta-5 [Apostichopus japonicus]|uniref:Putative protocadherin beta-5 n=1 Tax=Stichopus japonicus TaxID=307972 RepID=A0A2G8KTB3_STIJA|nr:putative protocadherin beta-5 [Apostichopus japonicus]
MDVNDNPPTFFLNNYDASILENAPVGSPVITMVAGDLDASPEFREQAYSIVQGEQDSSFFIIDESTGEITTDSSFDREKDKEVYVINVLARNVLDLADGGANQAQASVSIYILDENDFEPYFNDTSPYSVTIREECSTWR